MDPREQPSTVPYPSTAGKEPMGQRDHYCVSHRYHNNIIIHVCSRSPNRYGTTRVYYTHVCTNITRIIYSSVKSFLLRLGVRGTRNRHQTRSTAVGRSFCEHNLRAHGTNAWWRQTLTDLSPSRVHPRTAITIYDRGKESSPTRAICFFVLYAVHVILLLFRDESHNISTRLGRIVRPRLQAPRPAVTKISKISLVAAVKDAIELLWRHSSILPFEYLRAIISVFE